MSLKDTFSKLKTTIVGTKTSGIDAKLDGAVRDIISYKSNSGRNGYVDLIKSLISKGGTLDIGQNIMQQGTTPATFGQGSRLQRYNAYAAIAAYINYCQRALDVLTDNILAPDDITKTSLEINSKSYVEAEENAESNVKDVEEIVKKIKIEERLDMIVKNTLEFGDFFCEIADSKTALTSKSAFLSEAIINIIDYEKTRVKETITEKIDDKTNIKIIMDFSALDDVIKNNDKEIVSDLDSKKKRKDIKPENLHLLFYDPKRVVKLQSDLFPICFGYLVFPASILSPALMLQNQTVNAICQSILKSVEKKIPGLSDQDINTRDLEDIIRSMIKETDFTKAMNIRYIPPDRIVHFHRPSTKYYPYGESIFDPLQFKAKVLIAMETAITILRLNRSIEKRKISVEVGLPRDAEKAIEKLKEEFKRRKVSLDSFGSVDTISCLDLNTEIRLTNGKKIKLSEMIRLFNDGNQFEIYSYNHQTGKVVPDKVVSAKITGKNVDVMKITLDNNEHVICTEDHYWMLRDGTYVKAKNLKVNDSLMPFNKQSTRSTTSKGYTYEMIYQPGKGRYELTHRSFADFLNLYSDTKQVIHHIDRNPRNNDSKNLIGLSKKEHCTIHSNLDANDDNIYVPVDRILNHKIKSIEYLEEKMDVGDIQTEKFHNFGLQVGVFIHNSQITSFEDIFIPQKDGKAYVDISNMNEGMTDTRSKTDELKFIRDQIVAGLGVPPQFIGLEESCLILNTYIPLLNGNKLTLEEIIQQYENGENDMYVYSYDHETGRLVPGKITWAGKTRLQTKVIRVHLDNGEYVDCTEDHLFMLRDGSYVEAKDLKADNSLMPFYTKNTRIFVHAIGDRSLTYQQIYHPGLKNKNWQLVYHMVYEYFNGKKQKGINIHHLDYNPRNNHPKNLKGMTNIEHLSIHKNDKCKQEENGTLYVKDICVICGKEFTRNIESSQITCMSKECLSERKRLDGIKSWEIRKVDYYELKRSCFICGKEIPSIMVHNTYGESNERYFSIHCCDNPECKSRIIAVANLTNKGTKLISEIEYRNCIICGKKYVYSKDKIKRKNIILTDTCGSMKCNNTILARRAAKNKKEKARIDLICPICGKEFSKPKNEVLGKIHPVVCNDKKCKSVNLSNILKLRYKDNLIKENCVICGKEFEILIGYRNQIKYPCCGEKSCKSEISKMVGKDISIIKQAKQLNHKVVKVESLDGLYDTGDITIEKYSNFAINAGIIVHNSSQKNNLSEENIMFARTIVNHQKYLTHQVQELIIKIYNIIDPEKALSILDNVEIAFPAPKSLQFERQAAYLSNLANLVETLERIGVPKEWSKKKYLTSIDWTEVEKFEIEDKIDKELNIEPEQGVEMGGFGAGGLMGGDMSGVGGYGGMGQTPTF